MGEAADSSRPPLATGLQLSIEAMLFSGLRQGCLK